MGYHPRIESSEMSFQSTIRCRNSEMWFLNNPILEERILAHTAKYVELFNVELYAFAIEGNHIHDLADYPEANRADFMRCRNSTIAKLVPKYCSDHDGGGLWERRYSSEIVPRVCEDLEERFFYTVLQVIQDGLAERVSDYEGYNCFHDAAWGKSRKFKVVNWSEYNRARRSDESVDIEEYTTEYTLSYKRLPGYEHLSQREYALMLEKKLREREKRIVKERLRKGLKVANRAALKKIKPGTKPLNTKKSERYSFRPRVLSICPKRRAHFLSVYFDSYLRFKVASGKLRSGLLDVVFPDGMYPPSRKPVFA